MQRIAQMPATRFFPNISHAASIVTQVHEVYSPDVRLYLDCNMCAEMHMPFDTSCYITSVYGDHIAL